MVKAFLDARKWTRARGERRTGVDLAIFVVALLACCLFGGTFRASAGQLMLLWPILVVVLSVECYRYDIVSHLREGRIMWLLLAQAMVIAVGLVQLPVGVWRLLPGHDRYAAALDGYDGWMSISLTPDQTVNSLLMIIPPLVAILAVRHVDQRRVIWALVIAATASAILGLLQMATGASSPFYAYARYDAGLPTGWFTNRNHQATLLTSILPLLALIHVDRERLIVARTSAHPVSYALAATAIVFIGVILATGSRSGALQLAVAVVASSGILLASRRRVRIGRRQIILSTGAFVGMMAILLLLLLRSSALDRMRAFRVSDDLRLQNISAVWEGIRTFFPVGSGYGGFDAVFRGFEADTTLRRTFFNNAHNDLLETAFSGGILGVAVAGLFLVWWVSSVWKEVAKIRKDSDFSYQGICLATSILIVMIASLTDYPLRTPLMAFIMAVYCAMIELPKAVSSQRKRLVKTGEKSYQPAHSLS